MSMDIIYKIMRVISCIIEIYLVYDFYSVFHRIRSLWEDKKRFVLSYIAVVIINIVINSFNSTMVNLGGTLSLYLLIGVIIYEGVRAEKSA